MTSGAAQPKASSTPTSDADRLRELAVRLNVSPYYQPGVAEQAMVDARNALRSSADRMERYEAVVKAARDEDESWQQRVVGLTEGMSPENVKKYADTPLHRALAALDQEAAPVPEPTEERG